MSGKSVLKNYILNGSFLKILVDSMLCVVDVRGFKPHQLKHVMVVQYIDFCV